MPKTKAKSDEHCQEKTMTEYVMITEMADHSVALIIDYATIAMTHRVWSSGTEGTRSLQKILGSISRPWISLDIQIDKESSPNNPEGQLAIWAAGAL